MRIGLIGWYGHSNAGDDRILCCLRRLFADHELLVTSGFDDAAARLAELNTCDFVLIGGGGLILRGTGRAAWLVEAIKPRLGCVGISIEVRHADNKQMLSALRERSEFILVRDRRSQELLDCPAKTIVGPDLTFLYPYEVAETVPNDTCGINMRPWRYWRGAHNGRFDRLMRQLERRHPRLAKSYPLPRWRPERAIEIFRGRFEELTPLPLYFEDCVQNDYTLLSGFFSDVPDRFADDRMNRCRFVASMRLHGLIFACQKAIPFLSLSYQPKNESFCQALGLPELSVSLFDPRSLASSIDELKSGHAAIRSRLVEVRGECHSEISRIMAGIHREIVGVGPAIR